MSQVVLSGMNILRLDLTHFRTLWKIVGLSMSFYSEKLVLERARWSTGLLGRRLHEPSQTSTDAPRLAGHIHSSRMVHRTPFGTSLAWTSRWQAMRDICVASCNLVRDLTKAGGVDLLLFCHRQGRITTIVQKNYALLYEVVYLCVPDTIVVPTSSSPSCPRTVLSNILTVNDLVSYTPARDA